MIYNINRNMFNGPIFVVGMPRSGTKLLRDLLNQHPKIRIPRVETNILPSWVNNWQKYGDLSKRSTFNKFYRKMLLMSYFVYMKEDNQLIEAYIWYNLCKNFTPAGVFEALVRHDAGVGYNTSKIWGDKSPSHIRHTPLLKKLFPEARFIHIIRDVRDYCLSINKAWGKNMIRAAQRWRDDLRRIKSDSRQFKYDYFEVKYEDLISQPADTLRRICGFLDIEFETNMLKLSEPSEKWGGDAKGMKEIKIDNINKYRYLMKISIDKAENTWNSL
ncbi:hypothetical protein C6A37_01585 [Desulfobacteraceae bacterium SEEP-SAG9]|nr:hypothetical protein C6A37_01585 [Desulfobacteraceae bacterium SEEP-SAG9]